MDGHLGFVVSESSYVSGYWIEPLANAEPDDSTSVYETVEQVKQLERKLRRKRERTNAVSLGGVIR